MAEACAHRMLAMVSLSVYECECRCHDCGQVIEPLPDANERVRMHRSVWPPDMLP